MGEQGARACPGTQYYHSVENGTLGDIVPMPANVFDGEGGTMDTVEQGDTAFISTRLYTTIQHRTGVRLQNYATDPIMPGAL